MIVENLQIQFFCNNLTKIYVNLIIKNIFNLFGTHALEIINPCKSKNKSVLSQQGFRNLLVRSQVE